MSVFVGPFELSHPFLLAPMAGITNSPYRRLMRRAGSSVVISELVSANGLEFGSQRTKELLHFEEDERTIGLQIFGERPELLIKACVAVEKLGADFVDLNLGCPVNKIIKKGAGCAMTRDPALLEKTLRAMVKAVNIPVTIKIRTGWNAQERNAHEVVEAATQAGVSWVAIHGRTRAQAYEGKADWEFIGDIKAKARIPILGNGDLKTPELAVEHYKRYGVDAVLIGRGALRNPFIFKQSESLWKTGCYDPPKASDYFQFLSDQKKLLDEQQDGRVAIIQSKKFLAWYSAGFPHSSRFRAELFPLKSLQEVWDLGFRFFEPRIHDRSWEFLQEEFLMGGHG